MSKEIYISSTPHETRLAIVEKDELTEIYYERENEYTLAGSIYNGRVTRVLPGMQSSFVDIGLERDAFLYITDFMEETDEAADFEGVAHGEARAPRIDKPRGDGRTEGRSESSGEGRERGRGRRGGRGNEQRSRTEAQPEVVRTETTYAEPESVASVDDEGLYSAPAGVEVVGEGAPGADGSRRWRGRRGRRRGRGGNGEAAPAEGESLETSSNEAEPEIFVAPIEVTPEVAPRTQEPRGDRSREGGRSRGGRDRGGRDRNTDRGAERNADRGNDRGPDRGTDRGQRDARQEAIRERFAPRGARPASSSDEVIDLSASAPAVEPMILPGESLSKYRRGEEAGATSSPKPAGNLVTAKPSTEVAPLVGWDGGATLPGETLSRHRETKPEVRNGSQEGGRRDSNDRGGDRGRDRRRGRDEQRGRGDAPRTEYRAEPRGIDPAEAVLPAVSSGHDVAEREYEPQYPTQIDAVADAPISEPVEEFPEAVQEFQETTTEYEPGEDAAASYRVDPSGPSEFRQSAPVEEFELEETIEGAQGEEDRAADVAVSHAFTSLQPTGEMVSEIEETVHSSSDPAAPIEHEGAVQSVHLHEAEMQAVPFDAPGPESKQGFAPGDGELEEELLDDDEVEVGALHAGAFEDDEDETLENAADLGSMIRDMSIDEITRPEPVEIDEDDEFDADDEDFEEDELASNGDEDFEEDEISGSEVSEAEEEDFAEASSVDETGSGQRVASEGETRPREGGRRGRRDGRRGGRDRGSNGDRGSSTDRGSERSATERTPDRSPERSSSSNGSRDRRGMAGSRHSGGGGRERGGRSMQSTNLPAISDLLKPGQELLVQIAKEPIAKKGARITSHIALPGRFLVFMPTVGHTGVSRKIESDAERRRLKEILLSERGEATGGFIVRTAAAGASEEELRSDLRFLLNLWADIKARSESSKSPALIYHDLNLIERILRDQVTDNFSAIWVDTENEYERVLRFLQRFQPSLIRRVKLYTKDTPLFEQFGITEEINKALRAKVWLKSGGSIVINQTEALVAIDINTGKYVGKTARLEDTILKTNLDAVPEIVRQIRLRDLGGIIIIDFIDMDERKNRNKVLAALEDELKKDRAPSKVLQFNDFGLVAITRKRVKQSLERTLSTTCGVCAGTGMVKSPVTVCNDIYIEMRKMHKLIEKGDIMLRVHPEVVKQLKTGSGKWLQEMEEMSGKTILVKSDPSLHPEQFDIH
jgi:ribonuclease E